MKSNILGLLILCCAVLGCTSSKRDNSHHVSYTHNDASKTTTLADGIYSVHTVAEKKEEIGKISEDEVIMPYSQDNESEMLYLVLRKPPALLYDLKTPATTEPIGEDKFSIHLAFNDESAAKLSLLTRELAQSSGRIANVIGGKVVSYHKVREEIKGGEVSITCCDFPACERLIKALNDRAEQQMRI